MLLKSNAAEHFARSTRLAFDKMACFLTLFFQISRIGSEAFHLSGKLLVVVDLETTTLLQTLSLLELLVVGTEEYGHIPDSSLQQIVDSHTKTASDIGHITIMINAGEQSEAVDDEDV